MFNCFSADSIRTFFTMYLIKPNGRLNYDLHLFVIPLVYNLRSIAILAGIVRDVIFPLIYF